MPHLITALYGNRLGAEDGEIGYVKDIYFDDRHWQVRYVVADTGAWLSDRQVLLSPHAFGPLQEEAKTLPINLTRQQIEDSPSIDSHRPVSRQYEAEYARYHGWPLYWVGDGFTALGGFPGVMPLAPESNLDEQTPTEREDLHLRSARAVTGYQVHAFDGTVGHVSDFLVDDKTWAIREVIVQTGHWFSRKKVRISPRDIERISYEQAAIFVILTQDDFKAADENVVATAGHSHPRTMDIEE